MICCNSFFCLASDNFEFCGIVLLLYWNLFFIEEMAVADVSRDSKVYNNILSNRICFFMIIIVNGIFVLKFLKELVVCNGVYFCLLIVWKGVEFFFYRL